MNVAPPPVPPPVAPRFFIRTYGCQMNERDSEAVACLLEAHGFCQAEREADADVLLYNTCSVREQAERKVLGKLGLLIRLKRQRPDLVIGVFGCMAERLGDDIPRRLPHVDFVIGTQQTHRLPEILAAVLAGRRGQVAVGPGEAAGLDFLCRHRPGQFACQVAVMRGCNQGCTYCIVPSVRGREQSRAVADVVAEAERLAAAGAKELLLLGQNITAYGLAEARRAGNQDPDASPFAELLRAVSAVAGIRRIRFTSPHPRFMNRAFVRAVAELPKVCDAFHVPLQSGADRILALMRRGYTAADYRACIAALRGVRPAAAFSTDVIVGFPGETEAEFAMTRDLFNEVGFDMAYIFRYSPRPGTVAARLPDDVPEAVKAARLDLLLRDLEAAVLARNQAWLGCRVEVLAEGPSPRNPHRWSGRTSQNKVVIFPPPPGIASGAFLDVRIERVTAHSLFGSAAAPPPAPGP
jgi:tRNA-2-methylthio-N6-dimethylallyladenosine synthase